MNGVGIIGNMTLDADSPKSHRKPVGLVAQVGGISRSGEDTTRAGYPWISADTFPIHAAGQAAVSGPVLLRAREAIGDFVVNLAPLPRGKTRELPDVQG